MKTHTLCLTLLLGLTPCCTQPMGKISQLCKNMMQHTKNNLFNTNKKRWIGVMAASGASLWGYQIHINNQNKKLIDAEIIKCLEYNISPEFPAVDAFMKNIEYATASIVNKFERIVIDPKAIQLITIALELNTPADDSLTKKIIEHSTLLLKTEDGHKVLYALGRRLRRQKKINFELITLGNEESKKLSTTFFGTKFVEIIKGELEQVD